MKKKVLCIALALWMCMMVTLPTFADSSTDTPMDRAGITASYGLKHISGTTYKMWAKINDPLGISIQVTLALYDVSYNFITSINTTSTDILINLNKYVSLSSGTYHLRLNYKINGTIYSNEKAYTI